MLPMVKVEVFLSLVVLGVIEQNNPVINQTSVYCENLCEGKAYYHIGFNVPDTMFLLTFIRHIVQFV